ncbi:MAG TPA: tetratricopeptide repeat protein, partial [Blastocatellia bacterium]|nr:tetratricopeptide repeat protein [Blastocatellia bacterium]
RLAGPYGNIGRLFELRGQLDQALSYYYKALALDSVSESAALINWKVGNLLAKQGDIERAQFYYREALRVNPHFAAARQSLDELLNGSTGK